jgi:hypothetical protein
VAEQKRKLFNPYLNFEGNAHETELATPGKVA